MVDYFGAKVKNIAIAAGLGSIREFVKSAQCRQRFATAATFLRSCVVQALSRGDGPVTCYTLRRHTASLMEIRS